MADATKQLVQPAFDRHAHFGEMAREEVVTRDEYQLFWVCGLRDQSFQRVVRSVLIMIATDEELGFGAIPQERERVKSSLGLDRCAKRN